ncbi:hypothetical protein FQA39_LY18169 [Lamprigera yunnana]|nr:hypothetical protein FQA39_LY18169 [Lamprigera yunnana]
MQRCLQRLASLNFVAKQRLRFRGYILFECIADHLHYGDMFKSLNLPDTFYSWFVITELHIWLLTVRFMAEGENGRIVRNYIVQALWADVEERTKKLGEINRSKIKNEILELYEQFRAVMVAYDEGLQSSDAVLAGALWRRLYQQESVDLEHLDMLVKYVRRQVKMLDALTYQELFEQPSIKWEPLNNTPN